MGRKQEYLNLNLISFTQEQEEMNESIKYFKNIIASANYDGKKMARDLNKDESILGKWKVSIDRDKATVFECKDVDEKTRYLTIYK